METMQSINLVSTNPHVRNGRPCIAGTTIEVAAIATASVGGRSQKRLQLILSYRWRKCT